MSKKENKRGDEDDILQGLSASLERNRDSTRASEEGVLFGFKNQQNKLWEEKQKEEEQKNSEGSQSVTLYLQDLEEVNKKAKEEFCLTFHDYVPLEKRIKRLVELRDQKRNFPNELGEVVKPTAKPSVFYPLHYTSAELRDYAGEKAEEEKLYSFQAGAGKGKNIRAKNDYISELKMINDAVLSEFGVEFQSFLSLRQRREWLTRQREGNDLEKLSRHDLQHKDARSARATRAGQSYKADVLTQELLKSQSEKNKFDTEKFLHSHKGKGKQSVEFIRNLHYQGKPFRFPPTKKIVTKLEKYLPKNKYGKKLSFLVHHFDDKLSTFLLSVGEAEYIITKENIISTAARKLMGAETLIEINITNSVMCPDGIKRTKWAYLVDKMENPKKYSGFEIAQAK